MNLQECLQSIQPTNREIHAEAVKALDGLIKPIGSLGRLEDIAAQIAGITGQVKNRVPKKAIAVFCSDNGVCEEGVTACPQNVTLVQAVNFVKGISGINVLSRHAGADLRIVDVGINSDYQYPGLLNFKIAKGTQNMAYGPAMTREQAATAIEIGIHHANLLVDEGYSLLGTGELGMGNTSTSSAILMVLSGYSADQVVGKGAGLTEEAFAAKKQTISRSIAVNEPNPDDPLDVLAKVGGFDIGGMTGCFLGAAARRVPVVIDGFISAVAALLAYRLNPLVREYMIPSHCSMEPGYLFAMEALGLSPMLNLGMRLGEGTGCAVMFHVIDAACAVINEMATFEEGSLINDFMVDIR